MLLTDDFVGVSEKLQKLIDVVHGYCNSNVSKNAAMVFAMNKVEGEWMWGEHKLP